MPESGPARAESPRGAGAAALPDQHSPRADEHRPRAHEHRLRVRYGETDQMGRVHHANFLLYLEEARTRMLAELGWPYAQLERDGVGLVVRHVELRYRAAALYDDELAVLTSVRSARGASVELAYEVRRPADGTHLASATTQLACIDLRSRPPEVRLLPDELRRAFERAQAGSGGSSGT
jgi:acyl-CoA thioester hydrolase